MKKINTTHFGILRIIVDDPEEVERVLKAEGLTVSITSVITACIHDRPGGLAEVLKLLSSHDIQIEYMYAFVGVSGSEAFAAMRFGDKETALSALAENNIPLADENDLF